MHRADGSTGFPTLTRAFRLYLSVQGLRPKTLRLYCREVEQLSLKFPDRAPSSLTAPELREYFHELAETRAAKTVRESQLAVRRFFRFLAAEGEITSDPMRETKLMAFRVAPQPTYTEAEVKRVLMACDGGSTDGVRDRALVMVLFDTGVRESELVSMGLP